MVPGSIVCSLNCAFLLPLLQERADLLPLLLLLLLLSLGLGVCGVGVGGVYTPSIFPHGLSSNSSESFSVPNRTLTLFSLSARLGSVSPPHVRMHPLASSSALTGAFERVSCMHPPQLWQTWLFGSLGVAVAAVAAGLQWLQLH